jgi:hypothetical protein
MDRSAVDPAKVRQAVEALEAMGRRVSGLRLWPGGHVDVLLEDAAQPARFHGADDDPHHDWDQLERSISARARLRQELEDARLYMCD